MERTEVFERLTKIFRDVFDDENLVITDATNADDIEDWDSLEQITLVVTIEKEFEIKFNVHEVSGFKNVGEMADAILLKAT